MLLLKIQPFGKQSKTMKIIKRDPLFEKIEKALLKAYHHIPAELEAEKKVKAHLEAQTLKNRAKTQ